MSEPVNAIRTRPASLPSLDEIVETFEIACNQDGLVDVADYLPDTAHPQFETIALELLCVDLERRRRHGQPTSLDDYRRANAWLSSNPNLLERLAFEEYRVLREEGQRVRPQDYAARLHIRTDHWPRADSTHFDRRATTFTSAHDGADELPLAATDHGPHIGPPFLDFEIVELLGEGKFAKVYLARQASLAGRPVVLKVTTSRWCDSDRLARLQHTNIVPIYSVHQGDNLQVVCMPFFGRHTLDDVLLGPRQPAGATAAAFVDRFAPAATGALELPKSTREQLDELRAMTFEQLVLWLISRVAAGLAHAHERGILHRDLKPANILLTDDGQPMILDFNLSDDLASPGNSSRLMGGTLPYMPPEHLRAVAGRGTVDARSDLYAVGVILFQMLTGQMPFSSGSDTSPEALMSMALQRAGPVPSARQLNTHISPAVESIVQRCLAPEPAQRYQSARQLQEDLDCQLRDLPLRHACDRSPRERAQKWLRRHPRLTSAGALSVIAAGILTVVVALLMWRGQQVARLTAIGEFHEFEQAARAACMPLSVVLEDKKLQDYGLETAASALSIYALEAEDWQHRSAYRDLPAELREQLDRSLQELLYLVASTIRHQADKHPADAAFRTQLARAWRYNQIALQLDNQHDPPTALVDQHGELASLLGRTATPETQAHATGHRGAPNPRDSRFRAIQQVLNEDYAAAIPDLQRLHHDAPQDLLVTFLLGDAQFGQGLYHDAELSFTHCIALWPKAHVAYFQRGTSRLKLNLPLAAERDFTEAIGQLPRQTAIYFNRAIARLQQGNINGAIEDYTAVIARGRDDALPFLLRSNAYARIGDSERADRDRQEGLRRTPIDADGWIHRGLSRLPEDADGALADFDQALATKSTSLRALQNRAILLAEHFQRFPEALVSLNRMLELDPGNSNAFFMRGTLRARMQDREAALADARAALLLNSSALAFYQAACILAETSRADASDGAIAVQLLAAALRQDMRLVDEMIEDPDLEPIASRDDLRRLLDSAASLQHADAFSLDKISVLPTP